MTNIQYNKLSRFLLSNAFPYDMYNYGDKEFFLLEIRNEFFDNQIGTKFPENEKDWQNIKSIIENNNHWNFADEKDQKAFLNMCWQFVDKDITNEDSNQYVRLYRTWNKEQIEKEWQSTNIEYEKLLNDKNIDKKSNKYKTDIADLSSKMDALEDYYQKMYDKESDKKKKIKYLDNILKNKESSGNNKESSGNKNGAPTSKLGKLLGKVGDVATKGADGAVATLKKTNNFTDKLAKAYFGEAKQEDFQFIILNPIREVQSTTYSGGKKGKINQEPFDMDSDEPLIFNKFEDFCKRYTLNQDDFVCEKDGLITLSRLENVLGEEVIEDTDDYDEYINGETLYWVEYSFEIKFIFKTYPTQDEIKEKFGIKKI